MDTNAIFERIVKASNNSTQAAIAEAAGVTPQTVSGWKTGKSVITLESLEGISKTYGCTMAQLLGEKSVTDYSPAAVIDYIDGLCEVYGLSIQIGEEERLLKLPFHTGPLFEVRAKGYITDSMHDICDYYQQKANISEAITGSDEIRCKMLKLFKENYLESIKDAVPVGDDERQQMTKENEEKIQDELCEQILKEAADHA